MAKYHGVSDDERDASLYLGYRTEPKRFGNNIEEEKPPVINPIETKGLRVTSLCGTATISKQSQVVCAYERGDCEWKLYAGPIVIFQYKTGTAHEGKYWVCWGRADKWGLFKHLNHVVMVIEDQLKTGFYDNTPLTPKNAFGSCTEPVSRRYHSGL